MVDILLLSLAFVILFTASITDLKTREVPDWLSYGAITAGILIRLGYSVYFWDYSYIAYGITGGVVFFGIACLMFYTGQWGGGDSKILVALGSIFGVDFSLNQFSLHFLMNFIFVGALYSVIWTGFIGMKNLSELKEKISILYGNKAKYYALFLLSLTLLILFVMLFSYLPSSFKTAMMLFLSASWLSFYLLVIIKAVEQLMQKNVAPEEITEGDWIVNDIIIDGKRICGPKDLGIEQKQIDELIMLKKKNKIKTVLVKYGIPFIPSFLLTLLITWLFGGILNMFL